MGETRGLREAEVGAATDVTQLHFDLIDPPPPPWQPIRPIRVPLEQRCKAEIHLKAGFVVRCALEINHEGNHF